MTLPSRFQKDVRTHLSRDHQQIHGKSLFFLNAQDQEIGTRLYEANHLNYVECLGQVPVFIECFYRLPLS